MRFHETPLRVRLSEVDAFRVVWHGRYVEYFEVGRTDMLEGYGLTAAGLGEAGFFPAVVRMECDLLSPARDEDRLVIRSRPERHDSAKLTIRYEIVRQGSGEAIARGRTTQVLLDERGVLLYEFPEAIASRVQTLLHDFEA